MRTSLRAWWILTALATAGSACGGGGEGGAQRGGAEAGADVVAMGSDGPTMGMDAGPTDGRAPDGATLTDARTTDGAPPSDGRVPDGPASPDGPAAGDVPVSPPGARGYFTTRAELTAIADKARRGIEPYKKAYDELLKFTGAASNWPHGTITGAVECGGGMGYPEIPVYISNTAGSTLILAKAYVYALTGDGAFAADARQRLLDLTDTTGWGGEVYSGANQCVLNLSWFTPRLIQAATLLEGHPSWTAADKAEFQSWLAREVYKKTSWASERRHNNWGAAGAYTSAAIADYLIGSAITDLVERDGTRRGLSDAWEYHKARQFGRLNGTERGDSQCTIQGIQSHGGIPDELRRGSSGCESAFIAEADASLTYQQAHVQSLIAHAELLLRRGDRSMYDNRAADGRGSIKQAILFVFANTMRSWPWDPEHMSDMEVAYRYYRDPGMCGQLKCNDPAMRFIATGNPRLSRVFSFATLTHGFAGTEMPADPPTIAPPGR